MDLGLGGKRALITGGSKGIGRATAEVLAGEGVDLVLVARDAAVLAEAAQAVRARRQVNVQTIFADLSREAEVLRVAKEAGAIDILVNNAGAIPPGTLAAVDNETWRRAWDLKVFGFISLCRAIYPSMATRRSGVIVNVIGAAGEKMPANYIAGSAGNAGLMAFTRALGRASPADGIRVVGINPGSTATRGWKCCSAIARRRCWATATAGWSCARTCRSAGPGSRRKSRSAVAFFASPRSGYTSGTILTIDGGAP